MTISRTGNRDNEFYQIQIALGALDDRIDAVANSGVNLSTALSNIQVVISNDSGDSAAINSADGTNAGVITSADWLKLQAVHPGTSPGNDYYWGTNGAGALGFYALPSGGGITVEDESVSVVSDATTIDFQGAGVTVTDDAGKAVVTIPGGGSSDAACIVDGGRANSAFCNPLIRYVYPPSGSQAGGTIVNAIGANFVDGETTFTVGGVAATGVVIYSSIDADFTTPAGVEGIEDVVVTVNGDSYTLVDGFTYNPPFSPANIDAGAIWFDFTEAGDRTDDGSGNCIRIDDANGSGKRYTSVSGIPIITDGTVGEVVDFDGSQKGGNEFIGSFNSGVDSGTEDQNWFSWAIFRPEAASNLGRSANNAVWGDDNNGRHNLTIRNVGLGPQIAYVQNGSDELQAACTLNAWQMVSVEQQATTTRMYVNAALEDTDFTSSIISSRTVDMGSGDFNGTWDAYQGQIAMRGLFPRMLSQAEREKLEGWAMHKLGLESLLPVSHPYKSTPPA